MEYIDAIAGVITGGGLQYMVNMKFNRKKAKLDYADNAVSFMEKMGKEYLERIVQLETDVQSLFSIKCENLECRNRRPPRRKNEKTT